MFNLFRHSRVQAPLNGPIGDDRLVPALDFVPEPKRLFWRGSPESQKAAVPLPKELRVLIVGDSTNDELMIVNALNWGGFEVRHKRVDTMAAVHAALSGNAWDLIICDYGLRATNGTSVLLMYREMNLEIPFIMISDMGEEFAAEVLKAGAKGYITKQNLSPLAPAVKGELRAARVRQIR
jgi:PleD family two-component response regulator